MIPQVIAIQASCDSCKDFSWSEKIFDFDIDALLQIVSLESHSQNQCQWAIFLFFVKNPFLDHPYFLAFLLFCEHFFIPPFFGTLRRPILPSTKRSTDYGISRTEPASLAPLGPLHLPPQGKGQKREKRLIWLMNNTEFRRKKYSIYITFKREHKSYLQYSYTIYDNILQLSKCSFSEVLKHTSVVYCDN